MVRQPATVVVLDYLIVSSATDIRGQVYLLSSCAADGCTCVTIMDRDKSGSRCRDRALSRRVLRGAVAPERAARLEHQGTSTDKIRVAQQRPRSSSSGGNSTDLAPAGKSTAGVSA